ncbi:MAG TPA: DUF86 domain-containing protein [Candidatus Omnitrophica bacterium]|nr:DUF86 domain-containing protein [Candidatus Omnitrophota bacterium]
MSERSLDISLKDILKSVQKIKRYTKDKSYREFIHDEILIDAVVRNLEVIGEAARHIPQNFRKKYSQVEWKKLVGLRDILIHEYFGIDYEVLWDIVKNKVPQLSKSIKVILKDLKTNQEV